MPEVVLAERYQLGPELGRGGMGTIYRARDQRLNRDVAVKVLEESNLGTEGRSRLLVEAQLAAQLNHPNIVTVYDAGEAGQTPFIVMEVVEGRSLHDEPPETIEDALRCAIQICSALEHAHRQGVIHRDLKPENVLITPDGAAKLMDFGLAQSIASRMTSEGLIVGTVFYLAPEQAIGKGVDERADLYSLGVLLYELVTGQLPFTAEDALAVISQHLHAPVVPPSAIKPDVPSAIEGLILSLMQKDPANRPASAAEVEAILRSYLDSGSQFPAAAVLEARLEQLARGRLVGRKQHLQTLLELWREAAKGQSRLALISGEPGVGKTRLANELTVMAGLQGATVLRGGCYEFEASTPYMPFVEAIRQWVHDSEPEDLARALEGTAAGIAKLAPEIDARLGGLEPMPPLSPNEERLRLFDQVARFFRSLAEPKGLLVFLDDLHWADQGSLQMLHYLLRHLGDDAVLFLGCYRELELDRSHPLAESLVTWNRERLSTRIALDRFGVEETRELLKTLFQEEISDEFVEAVHHETEGNPFFVEEVVKSLIASGDVYREDGRWQRVELGDLALPQSVKEAIGRRLDRLDKYCLDVMHTASALGKNFPFRELNLLYEGEERLLDALDLASEAQLIEPFGPDSFVFTHDKIREVLYQELNPIRRRRLHQRIGESLESTLGEGGDGRVQDMAHHFIQSGDLERGLKYSLQAAEQAREIFALDASARLLEAAEESARALGDNERLVEALTLKARNLSLQGHNAQAIKTCKTALELTEDSQRRIELEVDLGLYYITRSDDRARETLEGALDRMGDDVDPNLRSITLTLLGRDYHYRAQHERAIEFFEKARDLADPNGDPMPLIHAQAFLAGAYQHLLLMEKSNAAAREALKLGNTYDNPVALAAGHEFLAENAWIQGDWESVYRHADEDERIGREMGSLDRVAWARFSRAFGFFGQGHLDQAAEGARATIELAEDIGELRLATLAGYVVASVEADRGNFDDARRAGTVALQRADDFRQPALQIWARYGLARAHFHHGKLDLALELLNEADEIRAPTDNKWVAVLIWSGRPEVLHGLGRFAEMDADLTSLESLLTERPGINFVKPAQLRLRALLHMEHGQFEEAKDLLRKAQELTESLGSRVDQARVLAALAELQERMGEIELSRVTREGALALMLNCGMVPEAQALKAILDRP